MNTAESSESLIDSLPPDVLVVFNDLPQAISEGRMFMQRLANPVGLYGVDATMARLTEFPSVTIEALGVDSYETSCHLQIEQLERLSGSRQDALIELAEILQDNESLLLCCHNEAERKRLEELISEADASLGARLTERTQLCVGRPRRGFRMLDQKLVVMSDNELFSRAQTRTSSRKKRTTADSRPIDTFLDLREGDLVVHVAHGIARYRGLVMVDSETQKEEHLLLEFRDHVTVYVPVSLIHLVQKYIGPAKNHSGTQQVRRDGLEPPQGTGRRSRFGYGFRYAETPGGTSIQTGTGMSSGQPFAGGI